MKKGRGRIVICFIILCLGLAIAVYILFLGKQERTESKKESQKVQLVFSRNYGNTKENRAYEELISDFEAAHPDISIDMRSIQYSDYELRLRTQLAAGSPPDIMAIDSPNLALYANTGSLLSLDSYMKKEGHIEDIPKTILDGLSYKGKIYLAPVAESGLALFYNKHLFEEANLPFPSEDPEKPLTWEETVGLAKKIEEKHKGVIGIDPAQGFGDGEAAAYFKIPFIWQFGGAILSPDGKTASGYLDSKESLKALQFYQDMYWKSKTASADMPQTPFETGKLAMTVLGSWAMDEPAKNNPEFKLGKDYGVAPLPRDKFQAVPNGGWSLGISANTKHPKEAWEFIKYATSFEGSKRYAMITGDLPARSSVAKAIPELNKYPKNIFLMQAHRHSRNRPVTPVYPVVSSAIKTLFEEIGLEGKNVRASAKEAVQKINTGLKEINSP
ncbi:sugar ABC transporter substrate-binding protein [Metabacillus sp. GX 13764]|uniref:ABC transporter substrate-binding protein n=1 Tax=Metabacillus kandeliae TaxID=2900151 RepID=UPI001E3A73E0|nr:sugar ABC transporter substrate-binding protein [Metabacillus kandeliae]MCD7034367.1 sugar ABC transporter substrate-binding protein [Metabacillus kandeliae]